MVCVLRVVQSYVFCTDSQNGLHHDERSCSSICSASCKYTCAGVEMEAMVAASVAALTVYDMCKALDKGITIQHVRLERKTGGKSGDYHRDRMA